MGRKVIQQTVAQPGELDAEGRARAWALARAITGEHEQPDLFGPPDADVLPWALTDATIPIRPKRLRLERGRTFGDVWLGWTLWRAAVDCLSDSATPVTWFAQVEIPVGSTILGMTYYHLGFPGASPDAPISTSVLLLRTKMSSRPELMATAGPSSDGTEHVVAVGAPFILNPVTEADYRYWVQAGSSSCASRIHGVRIDYSR